MPDTLTGLEPTIFSPWGESVATAPWKPDIQATSVVPKGFEVD
jgi:hypothetical protein